MLITQTLQLVGSTMLEQAFSVWPYHLWAGSYILYNLILTGCSEASLDWCLCGCHSENPLIRQGLSPDNMLDKCECQNIE